MEIVLWLGVICLVASIASAVTPPQSTGTVAVGMKIINVLALNIGHATNK